jgi:hypothetical protein
LSKSLRGSVEGYKKNNKKIEISTEPPIKRGFFNIMNKKFYLTKEGLIKLKKEYETLKKLRLSKLKGESPRIFHSDDVSND